MYAQSYAVNAANISTENANAILAGKERNAHYVTTNARFPTATAMGTASMESALVSEAIKANFALILTALIQLVRATGSVSKEHVFARKAGRDWTVLRWIKMLFSVCQIAQDMGLSMLILRLARVMQGGLEKTVPKVKNILIHLVIFMF